MNRGEAHRAAARPSWQKDGKAGALGTPMSRRVRCCGRLHRITWVVGGRVRLHAHTKANLEAMEVGKELGAPPCKCLEFLLKLRSHNWQAMDSALTVGPWRACHDTAKAREHERARQRRYKRPGMEPLTDTNTRYYRLDAARRETRDRMHTALHGLRLYGQEVGNVHLTVAEPGQDHVWMHAWLSKTGQERVGVEVSAPLLWRRWLDEGLGVVGGSLVVKVTEYAGRKHTAMVTLVESAQVPGPFTEKVWTLRWREARVWYNVQAGRWSIQTLEEPMFPVIQ